MRVVVLGAGIIGLACAHELAHAGHTVEVLAAEAPHTTTSARAGAIFRPHLVPQDPLSERLLTSSRDQLVAWTDSGFAAHLGIRRQRHVEASSVGPLDLWHLHTVDDVETLAPADVPGGHDHGLAYTTWLFEVPLVLDALVEHLEGHGVRLRTGRVDALDEAADGDLLVNATGLGSADLCGDTGLEPVRGQTALVSGPLERPDWSMSADGFYFFPRGDGLLLGGTAIHGDHSTTPSPETSAALLAGNARVLPQLASLDASRVRAEVGLRPHRPAGVRVERDTTSRGHPVVHAYGHGGAGWTLALGTARHVADLVARGA